MIIDCVCVKKSTKSSKKAIYKLGVEKTAQNNFGHKPKVIHLCCQHLMMLVLAVFFCFNLPSRGCVRCGTVFGIKAYFVQKSKIQFQAFFFDTLPQFENSKKWIVAGCLSCFDWKINSIFDFWNWFAFKKPKPIFFFTWIRVCVLVSKMMVGQRG